MQSSLNIRLIQFYIIHGQNRIRSSMRFELIHNLITLLLIHYHSQKAGYAIFCQKQDTYTVRKL